MITWFRKKPGVGKKVFVGVSGGVDSSVTAAMLKDQGYDVTGVFIRTWQPDFIECTWRDERRDAMRVCAHLNIPFVELNLEQEYKHGVADYMIAEYRAGRTPNPDVMCNREVKFGGFLTWALAQGADFVATGHYARKLKNKDFKQLISETLQSSESFCLAKGVDNSKDQSYFLWTLTNAQLDHILFPVGDLQKSEVRRLAQKYRLPTATKKDSQGICFIGDIDMKDFLRHYIEVKPGNVLSEAGHSIGTHDGALFYTLGERHGFTITQKGAHDAPYYIVSKDVVKNTITVSQRPWDAAQPERVIITECVWRDTIAQEKKYVAQIRYHGENKPCMLREVLEGYEVLFDHADYSLSPGQSVVIYDGDVCIGGGIVK